MAIITAKGICKQFLVNGKTFKLLDQLDLEVDKGQFLAITGPSGAGKSTLLNILSGLDTPDSGSVLFEGLNINTLPEKEIADLRCRKMGFVFQTPHHISYKTVLENIMLPTQYSSSLSKLEASKRARELVKLVGLEHVIDELPKFLSGGELQRMAFARALVNAPKVVFADEPTGSLDKANSEILLNLMQDRAKQQGTTIIMVSHDPYAIDYAFSNIELLKH